MMMPAPLCSLPSPRECKVRESDGSVALGLSNLSGEPSKKQDWWCLDTSL